MDRKTPRLLQLLLSNAATPRSFRAEENGDEATIYLYDVIDDWYGVSAQAFAQQIAGITAKTLHLRINSPGGDVFAARAMATTVRGFRGKVISHIDGVAASAATYVALAAAEVEMTQGAFFMIHKAWALGIGNSDELMELAALLEKVDESIANDYVRKTKKSRDQIDAWMKAETWFNADEAKAEGFVDRVVDGETVEASWDLAAYTNAPKASRAPDPLTDQLAASRAVAARRLNHFTRVPA